MSYMKDRMIDLVNESSSIRYTNNLGVAVKLVMHSMTNSDTPEVGTRVLYPGDSLETSFPADEVVIEVVK